VKTAGFLSILHHPIQKVEKKQGKSLQNYIPKIQKLAIGQNVTVCVCFLPFHSVLSSHKGRLTILFIKLVAAMGCRYAKLVTEQIFKTKINLLSFVWPLTYV